MTTKRKLAIVLLIPFAALTAYSLFKVGYFGIVAYHLPSPAGWQVFADLVVALVLVVTWMIADAKRSGRIVWPYVLVTLFLGSFGPLAYLLVGDTKPARMGEPQTSRS